MIGQRETLELFCSDFGISISEVEEKLRGIGKSDYVKLLASTGATLHYFYFTAISLAMPYIGNILEIGTGCGHATNVLSKLFPKAMIHTIDLPVNDFEGKKAWRHKKRYGMDQFKENIKEGNIVFIEKNSFFLPSLGLPEKFDLIFVDGGHQYPVVPWDLAFAYAHLAEEGVMFMHDYNESPYKNDVARAVSYMAALIKEEVKILPSGNKEDNPKWAKNAYLRKTKHE